MNITHLGHSGFLVELPALYLLFDYYIGEIPPLDRAKDLYIFASHAHGDHYNRAIWSLRAQQPGSYYILSDDIRLSAGEKKRLGLTAKDEERIYMVQPDRTYHIPADGKSPAAVTVRTLLSTDEGVAFIVGHGDVSIFHAGDLNLWTWPGDDEEANKDRLRRFMLEMDKIKGMSFDAAFFPHDPRQGEYRGDGYRIFAETVNAKQLYPMHF